MQLDHDLASITGTLDGESLFIRNELHRCRGVRKLHFEIAKLGLGLQILHCVFFPDPRFDLPIFGADIVAGPAGISAAIVDLSPVESTLPVKILNDLKDLSFPKFAQERELPAWGTIFSPYVRFIRPTGDQEEAAFVDLVEAYLGVFNTSVHGASPEDPKALSTINRYKGQLFYCQQQKRNDKTRRVLAKAFNPQWADRYIEQLLFDDPPRP